MLKFILKYFWINYNWNCFDLVKKSVCNTNERFIKLIIPLNVLNQQGRVNKYSRYRNLVE